jgi:dipeptidyl aminopeptidase/acylaminoacyl peptidase
MYGESDVRIGRRPLFGDAPWVRRAPLKSFRRQSIIQHAWRATTPTIFHVGGRDVRVPPTQSILLYRALKAAGVPTELYVAPGEPHNYRKPSHKLFKIQADLAWFAAHLGAQPYVPRYPEDVLRAQEKDEEPEGQEIQAEQAEANPLQLEELSEQAL